MKCTRAFSIGGAISAALFLHVGDAAAQQKQQMEMICVPHAIADKILTKLKQNPLWAGAVDGKSEVYGALTQSADGQWTFMLLTASGVCVVEGGSSGRLVGKSASN